MSAPSVPPSERSNATTSRLRRINRLEWVPYAILLALVAGLVLLQPNLLRLSWVELKTDAAMALILVIVGQTIVILSGGIDLSVGGVLSLSNAIAATRFGDGGPQMFLWMALILGLGALAGFINGAIIAYLRVQPFIATLATWSIWGGVALWVLPTDGGSVPSSLLDAATGTLFGMPKSILLLALIVIAWLLFRRTRLGVSIYALGSSEKAAFLSGANVARTKILVYVISGVFAALAGIFRTIQATSGSPVAGNPFILTSVAAVVIGGTSLAGGRGSVIGGIIGAFILVLISDLIFFAGISSYYSSLFQGLLLIVAVAFYSITAIVQRRRSAR